MNRHFKTIILILVLVIWIPAAILIKGVSLPSYYQDSYYAQLSAMYQRLHETQGPKIVIVGGSNIAFGVDSALLEDLLEEKGFDYTVCNFGIYAAVGTSVMLDLSADALGEGDLVVLAMEPASGTMTSYFGATAFWKCAEDLPEMILRLDRQKQDALLGNYLSYFQERCQIQRSGILPHVEGVYTNASFNERCDMIFPRKGNTLPLGYDSSSPVDFNAAIIEPAFAEQVNAYCIAAKEAGTQVVLSFSPVNRASLTEENETAVKEFFNRCNAAFSCPVISDPNDYILDSGWFYDSNFHLNTAGATVRTCLLAEDILAWLGCYEAPAYDLPEMPASIRSIPEATEDVQYFSFAPIDGQAGETLGYRVSGLSGSGKTQTVLSIPAAFKGKPVVGLSVDALKDAEDLEELTLPKTIESIPDGLLQNCQKLTRLILEHTDKLCSVTDHTFDFAEQVRIYVPTEAYSLYRDGDGCEANPWSQYLSRIYPYG